MAPRRILVAVEPRLLGDALAELLADIGLDDVVRPGDPSGHVDLALVSEGSPAVRADLILRVPNADDLATDGTGDLRPGSAADLISILDRVCPASSPRLERVPHRSTISGGLW